MRAPHLRAAFAIAVRWEGVVLALLPMQVLLAYLWLIDVLPPAWGRARPEISFLWLSASEWGFILHALMAGTAAVLLLPLVQDYRGLRTRLLQRRPLVVIAAAAIPWLLPKALRACGIDPFDLPGFAAEVACATVAPAWVAGTLLEGEFGARRKASVASLLGSAAIVALGMGLLTWSVAESALEAIGDLLRTVIPGHFTWAIVAGGHLWAWIALTAQAWFLRRMFAPAPKSRAAE